MKRKGFLVSGGNRCSCLSWPGSFRYKDGRPLTSHFRHLNPLVTSPIPLKTVMCQNNILLQISSQLDIYINCTHHGYSPRAHVPHHHLGGIYSKGVGLDV